MANNVDYEQYYDRFTRNIIRKVKQSTQNAANLAWQDYLGVVKNDMLDIARNDTERFYKDYYPKRYDRQFSMYNIYSIKMENGGNTVTLDVDDLGPTMTGGEYAYHLDFERGWHGGPRGFTYGHSPVKIMRPSPYELIKEDIKNSKSKWDNDYRQLYQKRFAENVRLNW